MNEGAAAPADGPSAPRLRCLGAKAGASKALKGAALLGQLGLGECVHKVCQDGRSARGNMLPVGLLPAPMKAARWKTKDWERSQFYSPFCALILLFLLTYRCYIWMFLY